MRIAQTINGYLELPSNSLLRKRTELSFPNYHDKSKLADDMDGFLVPKINRIRSDIDAVDIDLSAQCATS